MGVLKLGTQTVTPVLTVITPTTGTISITNNGDYNVSSYATASVNVDTVNNTDLSITPSTSSQSFTPTSPYTGYGTIKIGRAHV